MLLGKKRTHPSTSMMKSGIIDTKSQLSEKRSKEVMSIFESQTTLTANTDELPTAQLASNADLSAYNTALLKEYSVDTQLIWTLAIALHKHTNGALTWICNLILPGLESQVDLVRQREANDPFALVFTYLSYGQRELASEEAKKLNDYQLAMYITHGAFRDIRTTVKNLVATFRSKGAWIEMSVSQRKCWLAISGELGFSVPDNFVVTEKLTWQCALGMYLWYGNKFEEASLETYNKAIDGRVPDLHHLTTVKMTAEPDVGCTWYQLLQWWLGDPTVAQMDSWPVDLVWLLSIFKSGINEEYAIRWIQDLENNDKAEWAIYAAFFLPNPKSRVFHILRQREWTDEAKLSNNYHIPPRIISMAKALNAHDEWDYDKEFKILIEGELYNEAKLSLLGFLLPRYFNYDEEAVEKCLSYVNQYPAEHDQDVECIKQCLIYITKTKESDFEQSLILQASLEEIQTKYPAKNTRDLFINMLQAIHLK